MVNCYCKYECLLVNVNFTEKSGVWCIIGPQSRYTFIAILTVLVHLYCLIVITINKATDNFRFLLKTWPVVRYRPTNPDQNRKLVQ